MKSKKRETVKVKIAVAINGDGYWNSCGYVNGLEADMVSKAFDRLCNDGPEGLHWIHAEIPVPVNETSTVKGTVTKGTA